MRELPTGSVSRELQLKGAQSPASGHLGSGCREVTLVTQGDSPSARAQVWGLGVVPWGVWSFREEWWAAASLP